MTEMSNVGQVLLLNLKEIKILKLKGDPEELALIRYFLAAGKVLNSLEITCDTENYDFFKEGLAYAKTLSGSTCKITTCINRK